MFRSSIKSSIVFISLTALFLTTFLSVTVRAHSNGSCVDHVVESCNAAHPNNYNARLACTNSGITACNSHTHGGGGGVDSASDTLTNGDNGERSAIRLLRRAKKLKLR